MVKLRIDSAVRLIQAKDVDVGDPKFYAATKRAALSAAEARQHTPDPPMTVDLQQYLMALAICGEDECKECWKSARDQSD